MTRETRRGDAWDLLEDLPSNSVDLFVTSPPYWGLRTYGLPHNWDVLEDWEADGGTIDRGPGYEKYRSMGGVLGLEPSPDWYVEHMAEIFERALSKLKPSGSLWLNIGDTYFSRGASIRDEGRQGLGSQKRFRRVAPSGEYRHEKQLLLVPQRVALKLAERGWIVINENVWSKPNVAPRPEKDRLRLAHESLFQLVPASAEEDCYRDPAYPWLQNGAVLEASRGRRRSSDHSATFPEDLVRPLILSSCPRGGLLVDPFSGTGTALHVAEATGRASIGFELSPPIDKVAEAAPEATLTLF